MNEDVNKVLSMPNMRERMDSYGAGDGGGSREKFAESIRSAGALQAKVVKKGTVKADSLKRERPRIRPGRRAAAGPNARSRVV
jgi:hypothetical protein